MRFLTLPDAIGLKRLALDREVPASVRDGQIALSSPIVIIGLVDVLENFTGEMHLSQLVLGNVSQHQASHAGILLNDFSQFLFRQSPSRQDGLAFLG